ncbi:MAG: sugar-binding domain-containing protein, partial [Puniceicoccales bacterium]
MLTIQQNTSRQAHELSGFFRFKADWVGQGDVDSWQHGLEGDVVELAVPGSWNEQRRELYEFHGEGWYERLIFIPDSWRGQRIWIRIGSTAGNARVWLDGKLLGEHIGPHLPFEFELTDAVLFGQTQRLTIAVDNTLRHYDLPPGQARSDEQRALGHSSGKPDVAYDFFPFGGIHRPVTLYTTGPCKLQALKIETNFEGSVGQLYVAAVIDGANCGEIEFTIGEQTISCSAKSGHVEGELQIKNVRLWSPEDPHLYSLEVVVRSVDGLVLDRYSQPVGVRTVRIEGNQLLLNGNPIFLRGVGKHEDFPIIGK